MAEGSLYDSKGDFNMAAGTLQRIHESLEHIKMIFRFYYGIDRQQHHIDEIKILFMNCSTLLDDKTVQRDEDEVDNLELSEKRVRGSIQAFYDRKKEKRLFQLARIWSQELRPYFMKYKQDPTKAILATN